MPLGALIGYILLMNFRYLRFLIILTSYAFTAEAAYYSTLPKGVRALVYRQVNTDKIHSSFTGNKQEKDYFLKLSLDARSLEKAQEVFASYLQALKAQSPEAYDALQLGEYEIDAYAKVNVQGIGAAFGLTDRLTAYTVFPYYKAQVNLNMVRTKGNNNQQVQQIVQASGNSSNATVVDGIMNGITNILPDASGGVIQSVMVNHFGYQPVGNWEGQGMGDLEVGMIYRLTDKPDKGLAATLAFALPTGKTDDPDIIQDIPFGDGQFDVIGEFGGGARLWSSNFSFDSFVRYTYQVPASKTLRIPDSEEYPLGTNKATFTEKLGDKIEVTSGLTYQFTRWLSLMAAHLYNYTLKSKYSSPFAEANRILAKDTEKESHTAKLEATFSTVELYKANKFFAPFNISAGAQKILTGKNVPSFTRFDFEFRMFF